MAVQIQLRRGTDSQWSAANPILAIGEVGVATDVNKFKIGDGATAWNSLDYESLPSNALDVSVVTTLGDLIVGDGTASVSRLGVGSDNQRLVADSGEALGLRWVNEETNTVVDAKGDLLAGTSANTVARLPVGSSNNVLIADSTQATGMRWQDPHEIPTNITTRTTNYTLQLSDAGNLVTMSSSSVLTIYVPLNASVAFPVGTQITILQTGSGVVYVTPISGVTINSTPGTILRTQYSVCTLIKYATDTWVLFGDLVA